MILLIDDVIHTVPMDQQILLQHNKNLLLLYHMDSVLQLSVSLSSALTVICTVHQKKLI
jgi:hypothetical protein